MTYVGAMRSATTGHYPDLSAEYRMAHETFGTPIGRETVFTEPHGFWWGVLGVFWPNANLLHVWLDR